MKSARNIIQFVQNEGFSDGALLEMIILFIDKHNLVEDFEKYMIKSSDDEDDSDYDDDDDDPYI